MELTQNNREALLNELHKAEQDADLQSTCLNKEKDVETKQWFEMSHYLALERVKTIRKALITQEIDY